MKYGALRLRSGNRRRRACVQVDMEQMPTWLARRINDLLIWDRETWNADPPDGWDDQQGRFRIATPTSPPQPGNTWA